MKWLFVLFLAVIIFGGAALFGYNIFFKQEIAVQKEQRGEIRGRADARYQPAGIPGGGETAPGRKTAGSARRPDARSSKNIRPGCTSTKPRTCSAKSTSTSCFRVRRRRKSRNTS